MGQVLIRNVDDDLKEQIKRSARMNGRSLEAEMRERLRSSIAESERRQPTKAGNADVGFLHETADRPEGMGFTDDDIRAMDEATARRPPLTLVGELDADVRAYWEERAQANGHTLDDEVRDFLTEQARWFGATGQGLGSAIARIFKDSSVEPGAFKELPLRGWQIPDFDDE